jgi:hypothetical protein
LLVVNLVTCSLSIFAVFLRLASRYLVSRRIWADDIVISVVAILVIPFVTIGCWSESIPFNVKRNPLTTAQW